MPGHALELIVPILMLSSRASESALDEPVLMLPSTHATHTRAEITRWATSAYDTCRAESAFDGRSSFDHAVIMFVQTRFLGLCGMRAPLHGCAVSPPRLRACYKMATKQVGKCGNIPTTLGLKGAWVYSNHAWTEECLQDSGGGEIHTPPVWYKFITTRARFSYTNQIQSNPPPPLS